jgi:PHD/YefM family antitoxin component YafN of YafNO toxin-antitoxin module
LSVGSLSGSGSTLTSADGRLHPVGANNTHEAKPVAISRNRTVIAAMIRHRQLDAEV